MEKLILIDGNSILNRAFYGIMGNNMLTTPDGTPTNAVYGFLAIMFRIIEDENPEYMAIAFDLKAPTKRHEMYEQYKATRKGMPDELAVQMPIIKEVLEAMNIKTIEKQGYEADDIIGTLAKKGEEAGKQVIILSGDRDSFQLISENITVRIPSTRNGKTQTEDYTPEKVFEKYGLEPKKLIDVKGLMGDASDNIPGISGVGEKTALNLIKEYDSIEGLYKAIEDGKDSLKGKLKEKIQIGKEMAFLSKKLGTIDIKADIPKEIEKLKIEEWDKKRVFEIFKKLRFNRFIERFNMQGEMPEEKAKKEIQFEEITQLDKIIEHIKNSKKMFYYFEVQKNEDKELIIQKSIKSISIYDEIDKKSYYIKNTNNKLNELKEVLEDNKILKIGANLKENYMLLKQQDINPNNMMFDIEIAGYLLNSTSTTYDINNLALDYLELDVSQLEASKKKDVQITLFGDMQVSETEEANVEVSIKAYCINKLYEILKQKLIETNQLELFENIEMPLVEVLGEMQLNGMHVDKEELIKYGEKLDERLLELTNIIYNLAGQEFNINSPKQLGEILFEKLELPVQKKTKSGYSTDVDVLEKLKDKHEIIAYILEYRQLGKLKNTYVSGMIPYINEKTKRIHSNFNQTITATGRISSSDPNLQNIPTRIELGKKLRKVFTAEEGKVLIDADYSQIELRVLAHISEDKIMLEAFLNGEDIHRQVASQVFQTKIEDVTDEQRNHAKAVNFGIVYGISDYGLSEQLKISKKEAKQYIEQYLLKYIGIKQFMDNIIEKANKEGYVETIFNRRRYVPELASKNFMIREFGKRVAMNTPIQGTAADIMKIAMINIYKELKENKMESKLILQVHDEIIIEAVPNEKEQVKIMVHKAMEEATKLLVPLEIKIEEATDWYNCK